ncbi:hypothetical protein BRD20_09585 [Halobacteriales archaeon SW_8_65_20]|nr:MAG: hypothetical protein BRD20_09585 [Halobacteriales archaeon SW_8_65_20]
MFVEVGSDEPQWEDPESTARIETVWRAIPIVPDPEDSCCQRLMADADVSSQDAAKEWLTFCRALELADKGPRGYARRREGYNPAAFSERARTDDWESTWTRRVERLLGWAVLFGLAERVETGYRAV